MHGYARDEATAATSWQRSSSEASLDTLTRRVSATAVDYTLAALPLAAFALVNAARGAFDRGDESGDARVSPWLRWIAVPLLIDAPVCIAIALAEARGGSPGKRLLDLEVTTDRGSRPTFADALARTTVKVAVPWELGHQAAWEFAAGRTRRGAVLAAASQMWTATQLVLMVRGGRTWADAVAGTRVRRRRSRVGRLPT